MNYQQLKDQLARVDYGLHVTGLEIEFLKAKHSALNQLCLDDNIEPKPQFRRHWSQHYDIQFRIWEVEQERLSLIEDLVEIKERIDNYEKAVSCDN